MKNLEQNIDKNFNYSKSDFGDDFILGVASSAFQAERNNDAFRKGASIWDEFSSRNKTTLKYDSPNSAMNFHENYKEDVKLVKALSIPYFSFSISWSRILPNGIGEINQEGINFYNDVLDACIENKIEPFVTLYHSDLPHELEKKGGWTNRTILDWFEEYTKVCVNAFKTKVKYWVVLSEPSVFVGVGYFIGIHTPGKKGIKNFLPAMHHSLLCQSIGYKTIKEIDVTSQVGTTFSCSYISPKTNSEKNSKAAERIDALLNKAFIEPSLGLGYPIASLPFLKHINKYLVKGDEDLIKVEFDFIGLQNYTREVVEHNSYTPYVNAKLIRANKRNVDSTLIDWDIHRKSIYMMILKFSEYSGVKKIIITGNGASILDEVKSDIINDEKSINYKESYLQQVLYSKEKTDKVKGCFI